MTTKKNVVPASQIKEVELFEATCQKLADLKAINPYFFKLLSDLTTEYNTRLEAAATAVLEQGVSCGPFSLLSEAVSYDGEKLHEMLGEKKFNEVGEVVVKPTYAVDKKRLEQAVLNGTVAPADVKAVKKVVLRYSKPKPIVLP
jgi:hypothetical protein